MERALVGRRVLTVRELTFHEKRKRDGKELWPRDLGGQDFLDIFQTWAEKATENPHADEKNQRWLRIQTVERVAPRLLLLQVSIGTFGERGELVNIETQEVDAELSERQAATGVCRLLLAVPPICAPAFLLAEESFRGASGGAVMKFFLRDFRETNQVATLEHTMAVESEAWSEHARLKEVEVQVKARPADVSDDAVLEVGTLSHIAKPEKRKWFSRSLLSKLNDKKQLVALVGVKDLGEDHEVYVTMQRDGRQKKFILGDDSAPRIREVLNEAAEDPVSDEKFLEVGIGKVRDLLARLNEEWHDEWGAAQDT